jgi:hypothetical protein
VGVTVPIIKKFQCDNPRCNSEALPEDGGTEKKPLAPYNWYEVNAMRVGSGSVTVVVCEIECIEPAILDAEREAGDRADS